MLIKAQHNNPKIRQFPLIKKDYLLVIRGKDLHFLDYGVWEQTELFRLFLILDQTVDYLVDYPEVVKFQ